MSSYYKIIIIFLFIFLFTSCSNVQNTINMKKYENFFSQENKLIMLALDYEKNNNNEEARKLYKKLFDQTSNSEYLIKYLAISLNMKKFDDIINISKKYLKNHNDIKILKIYTLTLIHQNKLNKALKSALFLSKQDKTNANYRILGLIYFKAKKYKEALKVYQNLYDKHLDAKDLIYIVDILYIYLDKKEIAIAYLETHIKLHKSSQKIYNKLLNIYYKEKNTKSIIKVLKAKYFSLNNQNNIKEKKQTYELLVHYLGKKDINLLIKFLEKNKLNNYKLLSLYQQNNQKNKALILSKKMYKNSGDINLLAQIAILEFQLAKNKKDVLLDVIKKFEETLTVLNNHQYQNYLAYLLIDFDVDIRQGLILVKKALQKDPNNFAYLDTLAWGEYKINNCKQAYKSMKIVIDNVGIKDKEIKLHWDKIKECLNK